MRDDAGGVALIAIVSSWTSCSHWSGRRMKIVVDRDLCESNGLCVEVCPEVFRIDAQDRLLARVERAVQVCPRQALRVDDD
jgi:ferredoxin